MVEQEKRHTQKIRQSQNDKIVHLIKSKLTPMHKKVIYLNKSQNKIFPRILQPLDLNKTQLTKTQFRFMYKQVPIVQKHVSYDRQINKQIRNVSLFKKVKLHIEEMKKVITDEQLESARHKMPKLSLGSYIELFSRPQEEKHSKSTLQLNRFKRESLVLNIFDNIENSGLKQIEKGMTEEEICLMNAKFRKQLNHRKLIGIWKIRNRM